MFLKSNKSVIALVVSSAVYPSFSQAETVAPLTLPLGHLEDRLTINVGVDGGPAQKYIFDTGSDQLNAALGQQDTSKMPVLGDAYAYLYGNDGWGGYWLQSKLARTLTYYTDGEHPTPVVTPDTQGRGYVIGHVEHLLLDANHGGRISTVPITTTELDDGTQKPIYIDLDAEERMKAGQPTEEQNEEVRHYYGTFGTADFAGTDSGGGPIGTLTKSGFIVAGNDNQDAVSPGCAPCAIVNLNPALRAQFSSLIPWDAQYEDGDRTSFPGSGAPASSAHEGRYNYTVEMLVDGKRKVIDINSPSVQGAVLFDTGNPSDSTLESAKLSAVLQQQGLVFDKDGENKNTVLSVTLHPLDSNGNRIGNGIVLQNLSGAPLDISADGSDDSSWNITMGLGFFQQYSAMYDLENRLTAFSPFFVSADNFTTDKKGKGALLNRITADMGNQASAPVGDPSGQWMTKGYLGLAGVVSGSGDLALQPGAVVNMTGKNTYTGATHVAQNAVLFLSGPGSIATSSELVNDGWFDIAAHGNGNPLWGVSADENDVTIQSLSGKGVVSLGDRNLILENAKGDFSGRITDYDLHNGGREHLNGGVAIAAGHQVFRGNNDYTGATYIASDAALQLAKGGTLAGDVISRGVFVANGVVQGNVQMLADGAIGGNGQIGSLTAARGSRVSPGNSIGTLNVQGDLNMAPGSRYVVEANATGSDRLSVTGTSTVDDATLSVVPYLRQNLLAKSGTVPSLLGSSSTILTSEGGVTGHFATAESTPFMSPSLTYQPDNVNLTVNRSDTPFSRAATTHSQRRLADSLEQLPDSNPLYQSLLMAPSMDDAHHALQQLSGQIHADVASSLVNNSRYLRDTLNRRLRQSFGQDSHSDIKQDENNVWVTLLGNWQNASSKGETQGFNDSTFGFLLGGDVETQEGWRIGTATGYSRTSLHGKNATASSDNYHLGLYTGKSYGHLNLRGGTAYTWHRIETARSVGYYGQFDRDKAHYNAGTGQLFAETGYQLNYASLQLEPFANLAWVDYRSDNIAERGGAAALKGDSQHTSALLSTLGLRVDKVWPMGKTHAVTLGGELGWQHQYTDPQRKVGLRFKGSDSTFDATAVSASRDGMVINAGMGVDIASGVVVSLNYTALLSNNYQDNGLNANLKWRF